MHRQCLGAEARTRNPVPEEEQQTLTITHILRVRAEERAHHNSSRKLLCSRVSDAENLQRELWRTESNTELWFYGAQERRQRTGEKLRTGIGVEEEETSTALVGAALG